MLASALVFFLCENAITRSVADSVFASPARAREGQVAQSSIRDRDLRGRQRHIDEYRDAPRRRDNDRFLRERREETPDELRDLQRTPRESEPPDRSGDIPRRDDSLPPSRVRQSVEQFCPGTLVEATLKDHGIGLAYDVTIERPNGRRVNLLVDALSGAVLSGRCN